MRVRKPFLATFGALIVFTGYIGLAPIVIYNPYTHSDKVLHFFTFFLFTISFYWSFETSRRRATQLTLLTITLFLSISSEVAQGLIPNGRDFDYLDIVGNALGSLAGVGLCSLYHKRMLERKRLAKGFAHVGDEEAGLVDGAEGVELEVGSGAQELGGAGAGVVQGVAKGPVDEGGGSSNLDETLDNWDENAEDEWDEEGDEGAKRAAIGKPTD